MAILFCLCFVRVGFAKLWLSLLFYSSIFGLWNNLTFSLKASSLAFLTLSSVLGSVILAYFCLSISSST